MTEEAPEVQAEQADEVPVPEPVVTPEPVEPVESDADRLARLRAEVAQIEVRQPAPPGTVRLKVELPHSSFWFGATGVGDDWTPVPLTLVPGLMQAAAEAGVTLTQEG